VSFDGEVCGDDPGERRKAFWPILSAPRISSLGIVEAATRVNTLHSFDR
jgi:hypothetical protein